MSSEEVSVTSHNSSQICIPVYLFHGRQTIQPHHPIFHPSIGSFSLVCYLTDRMNYSPSPSPHNSRPPTALLTLFEVFCLLPLIAFRCCQVAACRAPFARPIIRVSSAFLTPCPLFRVLDTFVFSHVGGSVENLKQLPLVSERQFPQLDFLRQPSTGC